MAKTALEGLKLDEERYVTLLRKLIGESEYLQNTGVGTAFVPEEDRAVKHVLTELKPFTVENGGPLEVEHVVFTEGRGNVIIKYKGTGPEDKVLSFVGSHLDVVPANPETWERNPFELSVEGDKLYGRGTTDCLGHVALMTTLFCQLAELKPELETSLTCIFIASEEASGPGIGVDGLLEAGKLEPLKSGPVVWVDCADSQPCIGTAGAITWHVKANGHLFHSGLPHKGINSLELGMEAVSRIQNAFYEKFPPCEQETEYKFTTPSTMKPTQMRCAEGGLNQLPPHATISGDIRLTPFYSVADVKACVEAEVAAINAEIAGGGGSLPTRGPCSKYNIPGVDGADPIVGSLELSWGDHLLTGIACDLSSEGFKRLCEATEEVKGHSAPYSITGSLPLVHEMQAAGFDIQLIGFGLMKTYHANNEYCLLSDMADATKILSRMIAKFG